MIGLEILVNTANLFYLLSYSVRDIFWLRVLTVIGGLLLMPYYYMQPEPLWAPIGWNAFFLVINVYWIVLLLAERRPVPFTEEQRRLYQLALQNMSERQAFNLLRKAHRISLPSGAVLISEDHSVHQLSLIADGDVSVEENGSVVDTLGTANFIGATAFLSQDEQFTAPVTVRSTTPVTLLTWTFHDLISTFSGDPDLRIAVEASLGMEISRWLQRTRQKLVHA